MKLAAAVLAAVLALGGQAAHAAEFSIGPFASAQYLYDSNVYRFSSQMQRDVVAGGFPQAADLADRVHRYVVGAEGGYTIEQQRFTGTVEGRRYDYEDLNTLDHNERGWGARYDGGILSVLSMQTEYHDDRRMGTFEDRHTAEPVMEHERIGKGLFSIAVTPMWHVDLGGSARMLRSPIPAGVATTVPPGTFPGVSTTTTFPPRNPMPNYAVHESTGQLGLRYGIENKEHPEVEAPLVMGAVLEYRDISLSGVERQPDPPVLPPPTQLDREKFHGYNTLSLEGLATYTVSSLSALEARLGATLFNPHEVNQESQPELTGRIAYRRRFSVVTEARAEVFRRIATRDVTAEGTTETGAGIGLKWQPLLDLLVLADYSYAQSAYQAGTATPVNKGRSDDVNTATLSLGYPFLRYFSVRVFGGWTDRRSNRSWQNFQDKQAGAELEFRWRQGKEKTE
ncbi:MAG TPA: hypothetical protein VM369_11195 [Candidatus Binatia bacterium]|nr:hypothetical protein [Candidatus Binatia bacterium]